MGARATVLNELRGTQKQLQEQGNSASSLSERDIASQSLAGQSPTSPVIYGSQGTPSPYSMTTMTMAREGLETITIDACIDAYMQHIWPVVPFLTEEILRTEANQTSSSLLSRQFIISFCAYVVTFGKVLNETLISTSATSEQELGSRLLEAALRIQVPERITGVSRQAVFISFFLYGAHAGLGEYRQGWFYLREAMTLFMMQRGEDERAWYSEAVRARLFWILVISER